MMLQSFAALQGHMLDPGLDIEINAIYIRGLQLLRSLLGYDSGCGVSNELIRGYIPRGLDCNSTVRHFHKPRTTDGGVGDVLRSRECCLRSPRDGGKRRNSSFNGMRIKQARDTRLG